MQTIYKLKTFQVRLKVSEAASRKKMDHSSVLGILRQIYAGLDEDQEHFVLLALDQKNNLRGYKIISSGGQSSSIVDPRVVFRCAILLGSARIIVAHNHPSGDPAPSCPEDVDLTRRLGIAGSALGIEILDHIILCRGRHFSFLDRGLMNGQPSFEMLTCEWERQNKSRKRAERKTGKQKDGQSGSEEKTPTIPEITTPPAA
jgi:DNA repair protein RadC